MAHGPKVSIEVADLRKAYPGGVEAVKGISFDVSRGEVFGLLGPNGAGKSTTVGMLTTTIVPTAGTARVVGFDVAQDPRAARLVSSVVFQETVLDRSLSGRRNLDLHARLWRVDAKTAAARIGDLAERLGIADILDRPAAGYSGGQRRRLEIARALVSGPQLLFLDEPSVGLDPRIRAELLDVIAGLRDGSDTTILVTTHYLDEAERLCDRIAIMNEGAIVALDAPAGLKRELGEEIVELRLERDAAAALDLLRSRGVAHDDAFAVGATVTIPLNGHTAAETTAALAELPLPVAAITTRRPTLDDVYLQLTGGRLGPAE